MYPRDDAFCSKTAKSFLSEAEDAELSVFGHGEKDLLLLLVEFLDVEQHINFERMGIGHEEGHKLIVERNLETCEGVLVHPWSRFGESQFVELFLGEGEIDSAFVISLAINPAVEPMLLVIPDDVVCLVCLLLGAVRVLNGEHSCQVVVLRGANADFV